MIDVYWPTPNGHRITVLPEEASLEYKITTITRMRSVSPDYSIEIAASSARPVLYSRKNNKRAKR